MQSENHIVKYLVNDCVRVDRTHGDCESKALLAGRVGDYATMRLGFVGVMKVCNKAKMGGR